SEEHTSELQSLTNLVCRLLLEKKKLKLYSVSLRIDPVLYPRDNLLSRTEVKVAGRDTLGEVQEEGFGLFCRLEVRDFDWDVYELKGRNSRLLREFVGSSRSSGGYAQ